ncbi:MAG: peptide ABC transporter permease [Bradyrhizobiaceae bacterium]|nr:peptide ABC transporter permease [Bradyrhizobiaceae bacterium]
MQEERKRAEPYPAEKARQGEIILRNPTHRIIFVGGLVGIVLLLLVLRVAACTGV